VCIVVVHVDVVVFVATYTADNAAEDGQYRKNNEQNDSASRIVNVCSQFVIAVVTEALVALNVVRRRGFEGTVTLLHKQRQTPVSDTTQLHARVRETTARET
jgi:hypothetical protein